VQIRERQLEGAALVDLVERCVAAVRGTRTRVVVNDRLDVALIARAQGVHLRGDSVPAARVRALSPRGFLVGRSVHDVAGVRAATAEGGVDYLVFGTVFPTASKPASLVCGAAALADAAAATPLPVLAIGGMTPERLREVAGAGAAGWAGIGLFTGPPGNLQLTLRQAALSFDTPYSVP
jgi:thiamine-phosphate pyrophosphorylase